MTNGESIIKQAIPNPFLTIVCNCIERKSLKNFFILLKYNRCSIPFFAKRCYFKEKRKVVDFMYILALMGVVVSVIIMLTFFSGGAVGINIVYYIDIPSLILLCLITIPVLASARLLKDFNNAFSIALAKKDRTLENSINEVVKMLDTTNEIINFLSENAGKWEIIDNSISFSNEEDTKKYNQMLTEIILIDSDNLPFSK